MTGPAKLAKKAMRHKVIATRLAAEGLPLPVPLDAVVRDHRPMPLALDTGTAWKVWAAARGYADDQIEALMSALPSLVASTAYLIEVRRAGSRRWDADGNAVGEVSDEHRRAAAVTLADRKARREAGTAVKATKVVGGAGACPEAVRCHRAARASERAYRLAAGRCDRGDGHCRADDAGHG